MSMSLAKRYVFKLLSNCATVPVYLAMESILPRALGPKAYGEYSFAVNLFQQCMGFLDMGSSACFYNALSRRQSETGLIAFYGRIVLAVAALCSVAALCVLHPTIGDLIMPEIPLWLAPLAAVWAFLTWLGRVTRSINDAFGDTVPSELVRAGISLGGLALLILLFFGNALNIYSLFLQQYLVLGAMIIGYWMVVRREHRHIPWRLARAQTQAYGKEFFTYSHPLFVQSLLSFLFLTGERWLLQWFDGSTEQGFFALSQKVGMACFLFVSAMTPLIMRELSIAWGQKDPELMGRLFRRLSPMLYVVTAYFSCFTLVEASALVRFFGGAEFAAALLPVQIMALYPMHQTYGQLAGSIFHAAGRTALLRNLAALECLYGFIVTWTLLAPSSLGGLDLGATGLALKTVCVQFVNVNIYLLLASRIVPINYLRNLAHQIIAPAALLVLAFACREGTMLLGMGAVDSLWRFLVSGLIYSCLTGVSVICVPALMGASRQELRDMWMRVRTGL